MTDTKTYRAHWACAGLSQYDDMSQEGWACPDCCAILNEDPNATPQPVAQVQQERCIRPDCIRRYAPRDLAVHLVPSDNKVKTIREQEER